MDPPLSAFPSAGLQEQTATPVFVCLFVLMSAAHPHPGLRVHAASTSHTEPPAQSDVI